MCVETNITLADIGLFSFGAYFQEPFHEKIRKGEITSTVNPRYMNT